MTPAVPRGLDARVRARLYLAGESPNSLVALANLRSVLLDFPRHSVDLEIIDIVLHPERAMRDGVLMLPMLVKLEPLPERRVLGNLRDRALLIGVLGLLGGDT